LFRRFTKTFIEEDIVGDARKDSFLQKAFDFKRREEEKERLKKVKKEYQKKFFLERDDKYYYFFKI